MSRRRDSDAIGEMLLAGVLMAGAVAVIAGIAIAERLLAAGADANSVTLLSDTYRFTALTGAMGEGEAGTYHQPPHQHADALVALLLKHGAHPNDGQGLYNTIGGALTGKEKDAEKQKDQSKDQETPELYFCKCFHIHFVLLLASSTRIRINAGDRYSC